MNKNTSTPASTSPLMAGLVLCAGALGFVPALADVIVGTAQPSATTLGQSTATQIRVQSQGTGHGLIVPYFTTQDDATTMLNITNTDRENGKVVKLRIRGAGNGDALLSMTLLLAPGDMWAAALQTRDPGTAVLFAHPNDKTCTLPQIPSFGSEQLKTNRLAVSYSTSEKANQTREGTVEYITMADIPAAAMYGTARQSQSELFQAIKHVNGVAPCGTALNRLLEENFTSESAAAEFGLAAPTGGLTGRWIIMNVPKSLTFTGAMHAVRAVDANGNDARANFVQFPQTDVLYPAAKVDGVTADPLLRTQAYPGKSPQGAATIPATTSPGVAALHLDFPDFSTPYTVAPGADAPLAQAAQFTQATSVKAAANEYLTEPSAQFKTDWVLSSPARRFSIAVDHGTAQPRVLYSMVPATGAQYFHELNAGLSQSDKNQSCTPYNHNALEIADRDGVFRMGPQFTGSPIFVHLCGVVSVVPFNTGTPTVSTLQASVTRAPIGFTSFGPVEGWAKFHTVDPNTQLGRPLLAGAFSSAVNPAARAGVSANYGMNSEHWYTR